MTASERSCIVCETSEFSEWHAGLVQCDACGFITADIAMSDHELKELYERGYFLDGEYSNYLGDRAVIEKNMARRLRLVREHKRGGFLIEIGSAYGFFLHLARRHFDVQGYEISEDAARYASDELGVPTRTADFVDDPWTGTRPDVIAMWDVIEHLRRPDTYVERSAELLPPGGVLFLTTGDVGSRNARLRGARWRMIHPPTHLHYFSVHTLSRLLDRFGFQVVDVSHPGVYRSIDQILHGVLALGADRGSRLYDILSRVIPASLGVYINLYDIMCVVARRS